MSRQRFFESRTFRRLPSASTCSRLIAPCILTFALGAPATAISVAAFYAPEIITFGNAGNVSDVSVRFSTRLTAATRFFVAYRTFQFGLRGDSDRKVDRGGHVGITYGF